MAQTLTESIAKADSEVSLAEDGTVTTTPSKDNDDKSQTDNDASSDEGDAKGDSKEKGKEKKKTDGDKKTKQSGTNKDDEEDLTELEIAQARNIYKALKDPKSAPALIDYLAKQSGYDKKAPETPAEIKQAKDAITQALEDHLGADFEFLTPKLSKALNTILSTRLDEYTKDIRETIQKDQLEKVEQTATYELNNLAKSTFGTEEIPQEVLAEMHKIMEYYKPATGMTMGEYLKDMLGTAAHRLGLDLKSAKTKIANKDRVEKNRTDAVSRLASERGTSTETSVVSGPKANKINLTDAIKAAAEAVDAEFSKT